jgi:AcrR family transcriptional regulator
MTIRSERARATRERLIDTARVLFATHGYEATSLEQVQREVGVSRGALYHHFANKRALFEGALDALEAEIAAQVAVAAGSETDPLAQLRAGSLAWLDLVMDEGIQRIALLDAPSVLGWEAQRAIDQRHTLGMIRAVLGELAAREAIPRDGVEPLSHALLATLNELGLYVARAADHEAAKAAAAEALELTLGRLFDVPQAAGLNAHRPCSGQR